MLESNVFRLIMLIGSIVVATLLFTDIGVNLEEIKDLLEVFFNARIQKY